MTRMNTLEDLDLANLSGIPLLERRAHKRWGDDPEYLEYVRATPVLVPRPPR